MLQRKMDKKGKIGNVLRLEGEGPTPTPDWGGGAAAAAVFGCNGFWRRTTVIQGFQGRISRDYWRPANTSICFHAQASVIFHHRFRSITNHHKACCFALQETR
jgi:hypothetical protein